MTEKLSSLDHVGYTDYTFPDKQQQMKIVRDFISEKSFIPSQVLQQEISWFYEYFFIDLRFFI